MSRQSSQNLRPIRIGTQQAQILQHMIDNEYIDEKAAERLGIAFPSLQAAVSVIRGFNFTPIELTRVALPSGIVRAYKPENPEALKGIPVLPPHGAEENEGAEDLFTGGSPENTGITEDERDIPDVDVKLHHIANPGDPDIRIKVYQAFRRYAEQTHGRKVEITPGWAGLLLEYCNHPHNRSRSAEDVEKIVSDLRAGVSVPGTDQIGFDINGYMINGQTRTEAAKIAGKVKHPLRSDVAFDLPLESYAYIDTNRKKRAPETYKTWTKKNMTKTDQSTASAAALLLHGKQNKELRWKKMSPAMQVQAFQAYSDIGDAVELTNKISYKPNSGSGLRGAKSVICAVLYLCLKIDEKEARSYAEELRTGSVPEGAPAKIVRDKISAMKAALNTHAGRTEVWNLLSSGWNYRSKDPNRAYRKIVIKEGGESPTEIPRKGKAS